LWGINLPPDIKKPRNIVCRPAKGACDKEEYCTGDCNTCPLDEFLPKGTVCRKDCGPCDKQEVCSGISPICPNDEKQPKTVVCRPAVVDKDGTTCDSTEYCDGYSDLCPPNLYRPTGTTCRPPKDLCDVAEKCPGNSVTCPPDLRKDFAYTYTCDTTQYLCAVTRQELSYDTRGYHIGCDLGLCTMGPARKLVDLPWPSCQSTPIAKTCSEGCGVSKIIEAHCIPSTGKWICDGALTVTVQTIFPFYPHQN